MIKKVCYLCVLKQWPPKTRKQYRIYENAVAVRLMLSTPISSQKSAMDIVRKIGLDNLLKVQAVIDGKVVKHEPRNTFYQRLVDELGGGKWLKDGVKLVEKKLVEWIIQRRDQIVNL